MIYDPKTKPLTTRIALEVASHEAIIRQAYKDSVGVWTWSVGLTDATGHNVRRYIDQPASLDRCLSVFIWALDNYADQVRDVFEGVPLTEAEFAGGLSFHWNTGAIRRASWVKHFNNGDVVRARAAFMLYRKPASIIKRRESERDLVFKGKWNNSGQMLEYTRVTSRHTPDWGSGKMIDVADKVAAQIRAHSI